MIDFEKDFQDEIPYKNGVAVTGPMFKFVNALDDGIIVAVIVLATILIMFISTLCIRFTLMTKLEEEFLEIAVLKAIGISHKDIKRIYLSVYLILAGIGSILGYLVALFMQKSLLQNITLYMGNSEYAYLSPYIAILGPVLVFIFFATYIQIKLESVKNIKPVNALKNGESGLLENKKAKSNIKSRKLNNTNFALSLVDIRSKKSLYSTILALISLAVFLILGPFHIYITSENESFVKSLGMGSIDLSIDIQAFDDIELKTHEILDKLKTNSKIDKFNSYEMKNVGIKDKTGKDAYLKVSVGDHESFAILKAIGFTNLDLQIKQLLAILIIAVAAIIIGILLANNLSGYIIEITVSSFGVNSIKLAIKPFLTYVLIPIFIIGIISISTYFITKAIYKISISESIKE